MSEKKTWVKPALELGPVLLFFAVYILFRGQEVSLFGQEYGAFILATLVFVPVLAIATLIQWRMTGKLAPMQVVTLVLVVVFGGLSVWLNDPRFFKIKPTIIYLLFAALLGFSLIARKNWLQLALGEALPLDADGWRKLTIRMMLVFVALAIANEIVWRTLSESAWVYFKTFGLPLILFVFIILNAGILRNHALEKDSDK